METKALRIAPPPAVMVETEAGEPLVWGPFDERWNPVAVGYTVKLPGVDAPLRVTKLDYGKSALHVVVCPLP